MTRTNRIEWTPRRKSIAFSSAVLVAAVLLVGGALAGANGLLKPILDDRDWWQERSLTRHTHALSVLVGVLGEEGAAPLEGARVVVVRVPIYRSIGDLERGEPEPEPEPLVASTDAEGRAVFEVAAAPPDELALYRVNVTWGAWSSEEEVVLPEDARVRLYFDAAGNGAWRWIAHRDLEAGRGLASLHVGIVDWRRCGMVDGQPSVCDPGPAPQAVAYPLREGARGAPIAGRAVEGGVEFELEEGVYDVVVTYEGQTVAERLRIACDWERLHHFDGAALTLEPPETCGGWTSEAVEP